MSGLLPTDHARSRVRWAWIGLLLLLAFAGGLLTARYALTQLPWLRPAAPASLPSRPASVTPAASPPAAAAAAAAAMATPVAAAIDPSTLATREAAIAAQLAALEARTATVTSDIRTAGAQATRAEATLVAFAARRAIDRGLGLGYLEGQLRLRFGAVQPAATELVIAAARRPVTLEDLRQGLDTIAPDLATGTLGGGWLAGLRRELGGLVVLRRSGTPSPLPADRLARARRLIEAGQVEAARAEIARMPGAGDAANWLAAADRYIATRTALDRLEGAALAGPAGR